MTMKELVEKNRSCRRFHQDASVSREALVELVGLARLAATAANSQPLKFLLSADPARNALIFQHLAWAAYLKDWNGPPEGERPAAYIVVLGDKNIKQTFGCDHGIAAQTILLGAAEKYVREQMFMNQLTTEEYHDAVDNARFTYDVSVNEVQVPIDMMVAHGIAKMPAPPAAKDFVKLDVLEKAKKELKVK